MKRAFDIAAVLFFSPLWLPFLATAALAALLSDGRPVFFVQHRAGKGGRPFGLFKIRTMREGAGSDAERLTRTGRVLRALSLDELPQFFNILAGDMSLVGPRPLPVEYLPRYSARQARRHDVRPGLTGWAQVNGRNAISWEEKFRFDVEYVEKHSFFFDMKILALTAARIFSRPGINHSPSDTMPEFAGSSGKDA